MPPWIRDELIIHSKKHQEFHPIRSGLVRGQNVHIALDSGATSHQLRDHFQTWAPDNLAARLADAPETIIDDLDWTGVTTTPRYQYCLFVDSLCLESLDPPGLSFPVVKLLCRDWTDALTPEERQSARVYPGFDDGVTEYDKEDVGWMYMPVAEYVDRYDQLGDRNGWENTYVRPPYIDGSEKEDELLGAWRRA